MSFGTAELEPPPNRPSLSLERFLRLLLLRGVATRRELGRQSGFSAASITLRSQWLMEHGFLEKYAERRPHSKRPVETLTLRNQPWAVVAIRIDHSLIEADLLDSSGTAIGTSRHPVSGDIQTGVFKGLTHVLRTAQQQGKKHGLPIRGAALSVDGIIPAGSSSGMIFALNDQSDWVPCQPKYIHSELMRIGAVNQWTSTVCKLHGLAQKIQNDHRVAYFQVKQNELHLATTHDGTITLGSQGTGGAFLHRSINPGGPACYCGRTGCLDASLRAGKATPAHLYGAIQGLVESARIEHIGLEWQDCPPEILEAFDSSQLRSFTIITDATALEQKGLALLATESILLHEINTLQAPASHKV